MNKSLATIILYMSFITYTFGQKVNTNKASLFITYLNNYKADSLQTMLADDFVLRRSFAKYTNTKTTFINDYLQKSKVFNAKFNVINTLNDNVGIKLLVEDQSDYLKYLKINYPQWIITLTENKEGKINSIKIDTTHNYQNYLLQIQLKSKNYEEWIRLNYPNDNLETLYTNKTLFIKRIIE